MEWDHSFHWLCQISRFSFCRSSNLARLEIFGKSSGMFACGGNEDGQLGLGDTTQRNTFTAVPALPDGKVA